MIEDLKVLLGREPFAPFRILVTSGDSYVVSSPFQVAIGQTQLGYYYPRSDRKATLQLNQLVAFEVDEAPPAAASGKAG